MESTRKIIDIPVKKLRMQIISDVHLEMRGSLEINHPSAEILCLCGDIGYPASESYETFIRAASSRYVWVFVVAGNHEFYHRKIPLQEMTMKISEICGKFPNVTFLNNEVVLVRYGSRTVRVFGATLWSNTTGNERAVQRGMNDYKKITYLRPGEGARVRLPLSPEQTNTLHFKAVKALQEDLDDASAKDIPMIVLTHHLPSFKCIHDDFKADTDSLNCAFASDLDHLIAKPIILWAHGHSHRKIDTYINGVKVVSNPVGYPGEDTKKYDEFMCVDAGQIIADDEVLLLSDL